MSSATEGRESAFARLAVATGWVSEREMKAAARSIATDASAETLGDALESSGVLDADSRQILETMVDHELARQGLGTVVPVDPRATRVGEAAGGGPGGETEDWGPGSSIASTATSGPTSPRYRPIELHARGGLGEVYRAEDLELHREVALKEIRSKLADEPNSRARFLMEAEVTGGLEHPGIVPVYGLGQYADGRPYYAMRFIRGESLKEAVARCHAEAPRFDSPEFRRLFRSFISVCEAIEYAHSRGIVHRDLKPANVMMGRYGETLVVDWGLAKAVGRDEPGTAAPDGTGAEGPLRPSGQSGSAETLPGSAIGTPQYMSPEQAEGRIAGIGPASDIYSLGATLYSILTGVAPVEEEFELGPVLARVRDGRIQTPRQRNRTIPRPLEAICRRAMALKPEDRYDSSRALADDVEQWLAGEPVRAWREPWTLRLGRWGRRHRTAVVSAASLVLTAAAALGVGMIVVLGQNQRIEEQRGQAVAASQRANAARVREEHARRDADAARDSAEAAEGLAREEAEAARRTSAFLVDLFRASDPISVAGLSSLRDGTKAASEITALDLLDRAAGGLATELRERPLARATLLDNIGNVYRSLGRFDEAEPLLVEALALRRATPGVEPTDLADSLFHLAWLFQDRAYYDRAEPLFREALAIRETIPDEAALAQTLLNLGWMLADAGDPDAEPTLKRVIALHAGKEGRARSLAVAQLALVAYLIDQHRPLEAFPLIGKATEFLRSQEGLDQIGETLRLFQSGVVAKQTGNVLGLRMAERFLGDSLAMAEKAIGPKHHYIAWITFELAGALKARGDLNGAEANYRRCLGVVESAGGLGMAHPRCRQLARNFGLLLHETGRTDEGLAFFRRIVDAERDYYGAEHPNYADGLASLASFLGEIGRTEEAIEPLGRALVLRRARPDATYVLLDTGADDYARLLIEQGRAAQAEASIRVELEIDRRRLGDDSAQVAVDFAWLGRSLARLEPPRDEEAVAALEESMRRFRALKTPGIDGPDEALQFLAELHLNRGRPELAEPHVAELLAIDRRAEGSRSSAVAYDLDLMGAILVDLGRAVEGAEHLQEAADVYARLPDTAPSRLAEVFVRLALARLAAGDAAGYRAACGRLVERIGAGPTADFLAMERAAWACVLAPGGLDDYAPVLAWAEAALAADPKRSVRHRTLGAAFARAERWSEAKKRLDEAMQLSAVADDPVTRLWAALVERRLGDLTAARSLEDRAGAWIDGDGRKPGESSWSDRVIYRLLRAELEREPEP